MNSPISNLMIRHRNWEDALSLAFALLVSVDAGEVVCISGPSRVGKTRMIKELCALLSGTSKAPEGIMPNVVVNASNTGKNGGFSTKDFMIRMLNAVKHPIFSMQHNLNNLDDLTSHKKIDRITESAIRRAVEQAFIARGVKYLFIDETQHAHYASRDSMGAYAVLDSWKCLAEDCNIVLVIVGTYPLLNIIRNSPHLLARKHQVHLPRYIKTPDDIAQFNAIVAVYSQHLPLKDNLTGKPNILSFLYDGSLGCIGLLRAWFLRANALAKVKNTHINKAILFETRLSDVELNDIKVEIDEGEAILAKHSLIIPPTIKKPVASKNTRKKNKAFQRKPKRMKPGNRLPNTNT